jgi:small subunit ribosomal protein S1
LTEEQQDGSAPAPEAIASSEAPASAQTVSAIAVADEPVATEPTSDATPDAAPAAEEAPAAQAASAEVTEAVAAPAEAVEEAPAPAEESAPAVDEASAPAVDEAPAVEDEPATTDAVAPAVEEAPATGDAVGEAPAAQDAAPQSVGDDAADAPPAADIEDEEPVPAAKPRPSGPEPTTMEELLAEQDTDIKSFKHGDVVEGTVVRIDKDEMLVDIGAKSEGVVSNRELFGRNAESQPELSIGDTVLVYVLQPESPEGHVVLSLRRAGLERKWRSMQELFEAGTIIDAPVIDHNKGGLIVDCGIRGFVPISQIVDFPRRPQNEQPRDAAQEIAEKLQPYVGRKLRLKILEVNRKANRLILSEKVALYEERREKRDELFSSLQVGQKVTGSVRSIAPFGIFIDLGGIDGLVHKSELSWNKVNNPEAGYKVGDEVEAEVIDINHERGRISLSIRRLQPDPWESTVADFNVGDVIDGTVTKLVNFGAFVRVREGLEGLIHISELSHQRVAHPGDVVHEGQVLKLKIISLDSERHRLGLSLKQAEEAPVRTMPEPGVAPAAPAGERRERRERRERPERSYSPSDALAEPEGGIDTTLAAAFAQVRAQLADAETTDEPAAVADAAEAVEVADLETAVEAEAVVEVAEAVEADAIETAVEAEAVLAAAEEIEAEAVAEAIEAEAVIDAVDAGAIEDPAEAEAVLEVAEAVEAEAIDEAIAAEAVAEIAEAVEAEAVAEAIEAEVVVEEAEAVEAEAVAEAIVAEEVAEAAAGTEDETAEAATEADAEKA